MELTRPNVPPTLVTPHSLLHCVTWAQQSFQKNHAPKFQHSPLTKFSKHILLSAKSLFSPPFFTHHPFPLGVSFSIRLFVCFLSFFFLTSKVYDDRCKCVFLLCHVCMCVVGHWCRNQLLTNVYRWWLDWNANLICGWRAVTKANHQPALTLSQPQARDTISTPASNYLPSLSVKVPWRVLTAGGNTSRWHCIS